MLVVLKNFSINKNMIKRKTMSLFPHEVFGGLEKTSSKEQRLQWLRDHDSVPIQIICKFAFDPGAKLDLPEGAPPYKTDRSPLGLQPSPLKLAIQMLPRLTVENTRLDRFRKEKLFIQLLETAYPKDSLVIIVAKDKKLHEMYPLLTKALVAEAYPNLGL